jgi:hypothetical protein
LLKEEAGLVLTEVTSIAYPLKHLSPRSIFHYNGKMRWRQNDLFKPDNVWMPQRPMVGDFSLNIFINLISSLDVFNGDKLPTELVSHQPSDTEIPGADISDEIMPVAVVHDRQVHAWSHRQVHPLHRLPVANDSGQLETKTSKGFR